MTRLHAVRCLAGAFSNWNTTTVYMFPASINDVIF